MFYEILRKIYFTDFFHKRISYLVLILCIVNSVVAAVDINTANVKELAQELAYIGPVKAQRIIEYREQIGGFISPEQLLEVHGIGTKILEYNREKIALSNIRSVTYAYPVHLDLSPPIAKPSHPITSSVFKDIIIIIPLLLGCFLIFFKAWLLRKK